jgi:beta-glucanase (GH16 family)
MMPVNFRSWPADGEIDIMEEVGYHPNYVSSSLHANAHVHSNGTQITHEMFCEGAEDGYHIYAIEWTADRITTYVDGQKQLEYFNRGLGRDDWPYDAPFYIILNLAWGGDWGGQKGVDMDALPAEMLVDYVRVYQKPTTGIRPLAATAEHKSNYICDLQGRRVINPGKGIYIQDGRKIVIH